MGVSFKIAKVGSRYRPKPQPPPDEAAGGGDSGGSTANNAEKSSNCTEVNLLRSGYRFCDSVFSANCEEPQTSFSLYLFPDGFCIGKPTEGMFLPLLEDAPESLHPYDRQSVTLFSAIEYGWLPGDVFDDIPCKYLNGTIICEVWDYRTCFSKLEGDETLREEFPKVQKICLRMGMENVVKDLPLIVDDSWNYKDLLEVESRIAKALQPELFLSPIPSLDRLCRAPFPKQLELGIWEGRVARKQQDVQEINRDSTNILDRRDNSRNGCFDSPVPELDLGEPAFSSYEYPMSLVGPNVLQNAILNNVSETALPVALGMNHNLPLSFFSSAPDQTEIAPSSVLARDQSIKDCSRLKESSFLPEDICELQLMHVPFSKRVKKEEMPVSNYCQYSSSNRISQLEKELQNHNTPEKQISTDCMPHPISQFENEFQKCIAPSGVEIASNSVLAPDQSIKDCSRLKDSSFLPEKRDSCELQLLHIPFSKRVKTEETPVSSYCQYSSCNRVSQFEKELQKHNTPEKQIGTEGMLHPISQFEKYLQKSITPSEKQSSVEAMLHPRIVGLNCPQSKTSGAIIGRVSKPKTHVPSPLFRAIPETKKLFRAGVKVHKDHQLLDAGSAKPCQMQCDIGESCQFLKKVNNSQRRKSNQNLLSPTAKQCDNHMRSSEPPNCAQTDITGLESQGVKVASVVNSSLGFGAINSSGRNNQVPLKTNKKSESSSKITFKGCSVSPATGGDSSVQVCSNSCSMGSQFVQPLSGFDPYILQKFKKIIALSERHGLRNKKSTADKCVTSKSSFPFVPTTLATMLGKADKCGTLMDEMCMSKFLIGGNRNIYKTRTMSFFRERYLRRGNSTAISVSESCKLILCESGKLKNQMVGVELIFGEEDGIPISPLQSPHHADLFASQFSSLMKCEGYELKDDQIEPSHHSVYMCSCGVSDLSCATRNTVLSPKKLTYSGSRISILNQPHLFSPQETISISTRNSPSFLHLTRPYNSEMNGHDNLLVSSIVQSSIQLPNSSINSQALQFQQYQKRQQQQENIFLRKICGEGMETGFLSGFGQSGRQFIKGGNPEVQQTSSKPSTDGIVWMNGDRSLLHQVGSSNVPVEDERKRSVRRKQTQKKSSGGNTFFWHVKN